MKMAVAVPEIAECDIKHNMETVLTYIDEAIGEKAEMLLFPETVLTGLVIRDNYCTDKKYAIKISSDYVVQIQKKALSGNIWIAFGFIEIENGILYDSSVLIDNHGTIVLRYKRMSPGWCSGNANPNRYGYGREYPTALTPWGKTGFMLCGDLFQVTQYAADAKLDILLFPFARCFSPKIKEPQREWDNTEWGEYAGQIKKINAYALMANYIAPQEGSEFGGGFGGGFITDRNGNLLASLPLNKAGLLIYEQDVISAPRR